MQIQIKKSLGCEKGSPQTEKVPIQISFSFKWSENKVSPHVAFTLMNMTILKGGGRVTNIIKYYSTECKQMGINNML